MRAPSSSRMEKNRVTSLIWGMFSMRQVPSTSRAAGIMATAAFFAPLMVTSPNSGWPPWIMYLFKAVPSFQMVNKLCSQFVQSTVTSYRTGRRKMWYQHRKKSCYVSKH